MNIKYSHSNESVMPVTVSKIWLVIQKSVKGEGRETQAPRYSQKRAARVGGGVVRMVENLFRTWHRYKLRGGSRRTY